VAMYAFTGYLGAMLLLFGSERFAALYIYFSGVMMPAITYEDLFQVIWLLHVPPVMMWLGYEIALRLKRVYSVTANLELHNFKSLHRIVIALFVTSVAVATGSIIRTGSYERIAAWANYAEFVEARYVLFQTLHFFEFVNIYTLLPMFGTLLILLMIHLQQRWTTLLTTSLFVIIPIIITNIYIFQKKPLIAAILILLSSLFIYWFAGHQPRARITKKTTGTILFSLLIVYLIYIFLILYPVLGAQTQVYQPPDQEEMTQNENIDGTSYRTFGTFNDLFKSRTHSLTLYALMAPISRTSAQMIVYPVIFPDDHNYYPIDVGQDILGFGQMPDDNVVVWNTLYPNFPSGNMAAPFHVVLYSQGGLWVSMIGALVIGFFISVCWQIVLQRKVMSPLYSVAGSLILLFTIFISIDAVRNSVTVSYGLIWPAIVLKGLFFLNYVMKQRNPT
jgi:hypothetical protein